MRVEKHGMCKIRLRVKKGTEGMWDWYFLMPRTGKCLFPTTGLPHGELRKQCNCLKLWGICNSGNSIIWKGRFMLLELPLDKGCEIPCTLHPLSECCLLITHFGVKLTSFCLFLFSMKCVHPFASAAGHHTFHATLGFSFFFLLVSYPASHAVSSRDRCTVFSIILVSPWGDGWEEHRKNGWGESQGLCRFAQRLDLSSAVYP